MKTKSVKSTPNEIARDHVAIDRAVKRAVHDALFAERAINDAKANARSKAKKRK